MTDMRNTPAGMSPGILGCADTWAARLQDPILLVGRIMMGWIFLTSGWGKVTNISGFAASMPKMGLPEFFGYIGAYGELIGGILLIVGLGTRYATILLLGFTLFATFLAHRYWDMPPEQQRGQSIHFWKNISMMGGLLAFFVAGAGRYALDWMLRRKA